MDIGSSDIGRDGKRAHLAHVAMDGFHVLGGTSSGTFDGRRGDADLRWHREPISRPIVLFATFPRVLQYCCSPAAVPRRGHERD